MTAQSRQAAARVLLDRETEALAPPSDEADCQAVDRLGLLASTVESSGEAIFGKSLDGAKAGWNPAAERMYGPANEEIIGKSVALLRPEDRSDQKSVILGRIKQGQRGERFETVRVEKGGGKFPVALTGSPIHDTAVAIVGAATIAHDVNVDKIGVEEARTEQQKANGAMRDFIAVAAHDLRSPLASIVGFSTLLAKNWETLSEDRRRSFVDTIDRQSHQLSRLVDDLFTLSNIEDGAHDTATELIVLKEAIGRCLEASSGDTARVSVSCSPELVVRFDPHHLGRIIDNYLQNAFKYGEPPVLIEATRVDDMVEIRVCDSGPGVPPEFIPRLFAKFARADLPSTRAHKGTGLGLSIVRGLAEVNGGQVAYRPHLPHGSCFVLRLRAVDRPRP